MREIQKRIKINGKNVAYFVGFVVEDPTKRAGRKRGEGGRGRGEENREEREERAEGEPPSTVRQFPLGPSCSDRCLSVTNYVVCGKLTHYLTSVHSAVNP